MAALKGEHELQIAAVDEFNQEGHLIHSCNFIGAYVRGRTREEALSKFPSEIEQYCRWLGLPEESRQYPVVIVQEKQSSLQIHDADSDVLFDSELPPLTREEYEKLRGLALKSARDFETLYRSIAIKDRSVAAPRKTFYGLTPVTIDEMYLHTKNVTDYYFGEINVPADNASDLYTCRLRGFEQGERQPEFLQNAVFDGSYGEQWTLRKVCRRFVWHDRIHAKAMLRTAIKLCGRENPANPFCFTV